MKTIHYVYKITNLINKKYYIGKHSASDLNDYYFGSGIILRNAIKKYGKENFEKEVLMFCETEEDAYTFEKSIITKELIDDCNCYNISGGGNGPSSDEKNPNYGRKPSAETKQKISKSLSGKKNPRFGKNFSVEHRQNLSKANDKLKKPVVMLDKESGYILLEFDGLHSAARFLGAKYGVTNIIKCCNGLFESAYGYNWKYKNKIN